MILNYFLWAIPVILCFAAFLIQWTIMPPAVSWKFLNGFLLFALISSFVFLFTSIFEETFQPYFKAVYCFMALLLGPFVLFYHQRLSAPVTDFKLKKTTHFGFAFFLVFLLGAIAISGYFKPDLDYLFKSYGLISTYVTIASLHLTFYLAYALYNQEQHRINYYKWYTELETTNALSMIRLVSSISVFVFFTFIFLVFDQFLKGWLSPPVKIGAAIVLSIVIIRALGAIRKQGEILEARLEKMRSHEHDVALKK
jgi:hypothetical protein